MNSIQLRFVTFTMYLVLIAGTFVILELKNREVSDLRGKYMEVVSELQATKTRLELCYKESQMSQRSQALSRVGQELRECTERMAAVRRVIVQGLEDMQSLDTCLRRAEKLYYEIIELRSECGCR